MTSNYELLQMAKKKHIRNLHVLCKDELETLSFGANKNIIVNLSSSTDEDNGSHWCALFVNRHSQCFYFDPFGIVPPKAVMSFCKKKRVCFSETQVQDLSSSKCGFFCIAFLSYMNTDDRVPDHESIKNFLLKFNNDDTRENDVILKKHFF